MTYANFILLRSHLFLPVFLSSYRPPPSILPCIHPSIAPPSLHISVSYHPLCNQILSSPSFLLHYSHFDLFCPTSKLLRYRPARVFFFFSFVCVCVLGISEHVNTALLFARSIYHKDNYVWYVNTSRVVDRHLLCRSSYPSHRLLLHVSMSSKTSSTTTSTSTGPITENRK